MNLGHGTHKDDSGMVLAKLVWVAALDGVQSNRK